MHEDDAHNQPPSFFTPPQLFGKVMSEKAVELEIEVKATVTTWAFSYFPITLTMPPRKEAYTCRQVNASTICDVGTLEQFNEISCVAPNMYPIQDPIIHSINFLPSEPETPNHVKLWSNFTVDHGSSLKLFADFPTISVNVFTTDSFHPYSEQDRLTNEYVPIATVTVMEAKMHGKVVTGLVEIDIEGTDDQIVEFQDVIDILLDDSDEPEVLLYIQGIADTGNNAFLQRILALMPTIKMLDYENVNVNTIASNFNLSDTVKLQSVSLTSIGEDPEGNLETGENRGKSKNVTTSPPPPQPTLNVNVSPPCPSLAQASVPLCTLTFLTIASEKSPPFRWTYWTPMTLPMSF